MPIENRNLLIGTRLVANYKKQRYVCSVEAEEDGEGVVFVLEDGTRHKSPSAAGSKVMGGKAVNGWRFWSLEGAESEAPSEAVADKPASRKGTRGRQPKERSIFTRMADGRWYCIPCTAAFSLDGEGPPERCPQGHTDADFHDIMNSPSPAHDGDDPESTGPVEAVAE